MEWVDPLGLAGCPKKYGKKGAFKHAKKDAGIPRTQHPDTVINKRTQQPSQYNEVKMTDSEGNPILNESNQLIWTKEYQYTRGDGSKIIIQDHSAGHIFGPEGTAGTAGNQGSHYNVRPISNTRTGKVPGTLPHYEF